MVTHPHRDVFFRLDVVYSKTGNLLVGEWDTFNSAFTYCSSLKEASAQRVQQCAELWGATSRMWGLHSRMHTSLQNACKRVIEA